MDDHIKELLDKFPFLSFGTMNGVQYLGLVQNADSQLISMYLLQEIPTEQLRRDFMS